jgi:hypothetical protein
MMAVEADTIENTHFNAARLAQRFVIARGDADSLSLSSRLAIGAVGSTVLTLKRSFDGGSSWLAMDPALTLSPSGGTTREIDFDAPLVCVEVTTAAGVACRLHLQAHITKDLGKDD